MSLKCPSGDQELLSIDFDTEGWENLRARNSKDRSLKMTCCGVDVTLRQTKLGTQYFAHAKKGSCVAGTDTAEVMLAREVIAKAVRRAGWNFSVEAAVASGSEDGWMVDMLAKLEGGKLDTVSEMTCHSEHRVSELVRRDVLKAISPLSQLFGELPLLDSLSETFGVSIIWDDPGGILGRDTRGDLVSGPRKPSSGSEASLEHSGFAL